MLELAILIVVIVLLVTYKASLKYLAKGTSAQVNSWALETEANATEKVSKIKIDKGTVSKANEVIDQLNSVKWHK